MYTVELYSRVRRACHVEGMSIREAARVFGLHRDTVRKMLKYSAPPGYQRSEPPHSPKLDPFKGVIDQILQDEYTRDYGTSTRSAASTPSLRTTFGTVG